MPMARIVFGTLGPSTAEMVSASSSTGKLRRVSTNRIREWSVQPPK